MLDRVVLQLPAILNVSSKPMSQIINCRFDSYQLPNNAGWFRQRCLAVCEQFGLSCFRQECSFEIVTEHPEVFLSTERSFTIQGALVNQAQEVKLIPLKWAVEYGDNQATRINMIAGELKFSPFDRWFGTISHSSRVVIGIVLVELCALMIGFGAYAVLAYPDPDFFWAWVARNTTVIGAVGLPAIIIVGGIQLGKRYEGNFAPVLAFCLTIFLWPVVCAAWVLFIAPPMTTQSYTKYLEDLRANAGVGAAVFVSLSPWVVLVMKALGLDLFASGAKQGSELFKSFEKKT